MIYTAKDMTVSVLTKVEEARWWIRLWYRLTFREVPHTRVAKRLSNVARRLW
jgi:hypothetical protein